MKLPSGEKSKHHITFTLLETECDCLCFLQPICVSCTFEKLFVLHNQSENLHSLHCSSPIPGQEATAILKHQLFNLQRSFWVWQRPPKFRIPLPPTPTGLVFTRSFVLFSHAKLLPCWVYDRLKHKTRAHISRAAVSSNQHAPQGVVITTLLT